MTAATDRAGASGATIRCGYCGTRFLEDRGQAACRSCPLGTACRYVRCPTCGYENPVTPTWLATLRQRLGRA